MRSIEFLRVTDERPLARILAESRPSRASSDKVR